MTQSPERRIEAPLRTYLVLGIAGVVLHVALSLWRLRGDYFHVDDFLNFELAREAHSPSFLIRTVFGQIVPLYRLTQWLFIRVAGFSFSASVAFLLANTALSVALIAAIAARARTAPVVAATAVFGAAVCWPTIEPLAWWSSGVHILPAGMFTLAATWVYASPRVRLRTWEQAAGAILMVCACCFFNKAVFAVGLAFGVRVFVVGGGPDREHRTWLRTLVRAFLDAAFALVAVAGYLALTIALRHAEQAGGTPPTSLGPLLVGLALGLQFGWLGGVVGLRGAPEAAFGHNLAAALSIDIAVMLVVAATCRRRPGAVWLWLALLAVEACGLGVISMARSGALGPWNTAIGRYNSDGALRTFAVLAIACGRAYGRPAETGGRSTPVETQPPVRNLSAVLVGAAAGAVLIGCQLNAGWRYPLGWDTAAVRRFIANLETDARRLPHGAKVGDRPLPELITPTWTQPYDDLSRVSQVLPVKVPTADWTRATAYLDDRGRLHAIAAQRLLRLTTPEGTQLDVFVVPPFESVGARDVAAPGEVRGWFDPLLAPAPQTRIAAVRDGTIVAWGVTEPRPDVAAHFVRGEMTPSGFRAKLPPGTDARNVAVFALIGGRIAVPVL